MPQQIVITNLQPEVDSGKYPVKAELDEPVVVKALVFKDGHQMLLARIKYRKASDGNWRFGETLPVKMWEECWKGEFLADELGSWYYSLEAWVDSYASWLSDFKKKFEANSYKEIDIAEGKKLIATALCNSSNNSSLLQFQNKISEAVDPFQQLALFDSPELMLLMHQFQPQEGLSVYEKELELWVEPVKARFAAWYEMFPRSAANSEQLHGTFNDCVERLPYIKDLGFDTIYFPPIHPIGLTNRKGRNNALSVEVNDVGCPWAIGGEDGGHKSILKDLGSFEDFQNLIKVAQGMGLEIALDFAIQCSPDHPYLKQNPDWFFIRPDGSIRYAENPPKEYQDIYPINFWCERRLELWEELKSIIRFWIERGVTTFRVDNPHTKPFAFWEELIREIKTEHPQTIFLSEAFTTPPKMYELAKLGYTQSYTYFTWRNSAHELKEYLTEITSEPLSNFFRGNLFANTPDILNEYLQKGGRPAFMIRAVLAATLSSVYGIYSGYEICENIPVHYGSEEYLDSEKYQLKQRDWDKPGHVKDLLRALNRIRQQNRALQLYKNLKFYEASNPNLLVYGKTCKRSENNILVVVNTNPYKVEEGGVKFTRPDFGFAWDEEVKLTDLLTGSSYIWRAEWNYVKLNPFENPAHIFKVEKV